MDNRDKFWDEDSLKQSAKSASRRSLPEEEWVRPWGSADGTGVIADPLIASTKEEIQEKTSPNVTGYQKNFILRSGHAVSYAGLLLFTIVLYFRPYELFSVLSPLDTLAYWLAIATMLVFLPSQFALEGNVTARPRAITLVLLLTLAGFLSILTAINKSDAWTEFNDVFIKAVLMFIVTINVVRTERRLRWLLYVSLAVTFLLAFNAMSDYRTGNFTVEGYRINGLLGGMFGNPNDLALHFVTMLPLTIALIFITRNWIMKIVFAITAILIICGSVVTYSRGGFLGLVVAGSVIAWKLGRRRRLTLAIIGPIVLGLFMAFAPGNYGRRLLSIFIPGLDQFGSSYSRQEILNRSIIVSLRNPLTGIGMGNFHIVSLHETVSHNAFTQVSAEMGMGALIIYMMFLTGPIMTLRRIEQRTYERRRQSFYYYLSVGLQASLIGYMVSAFFAAVAYQWYAYYLVGYGVCLTRMYDANQESLEPKTSALSK